MPPGKVAPQLVSASDLCVLLAPNGSLWCWGRAKSGLVEEPSGTPQRIGSADDWCRIAASPSHAVALKTDGSLWCWGWGPASQAHWRERVAEPTRMGTDTNRTQIAAGAGHCLALKRDGSLWAWGQNDHGAVGDGTTNAQFVSTRIGPDHDWGVIAAGAASSFALKQDGTLWGWGYKMGRSGDELSPSQIDSTGNISAISAKDYCLLALRSDGTLWICGPNAHVTASAYVKAPTRTLVQVGNDKDWKETYAGIRFFLARKRNGSWWVCGSFRNAPDNRPLASPRRLPLSLEPWSLAPCFGGALLLTKDGAIWTLSIGPDTSKFAVGVTKLKLLSNQLLGVLPGHPQPFNPKEFRIDPSLRRQWQSGEAWRKTPPTNDLEYRESSDGVFLRNSVLTSAWPPPGRPKQLAYGARTRALVVFGRSRQPLICWRVWTEWCLDKA